MKHFLSVLLSLVLIFSCSSGVFAEEAESLAEEKIAAMIDSGELKLDLISLDDFYEKTTAVKIGDRSISPAMLNYSYITQYYSFLTTYGAYAANFGLNTSLGVSSLAGQTCPMINGGTWQDYFLSAAVDSLLMNTALSRYAEENGITLNDEERAAALSGLDGLEESAAANGFESGEAFLKATYGNGVTTDLVSEVSLDFALASKVYKQLDESIVVTDDEVREQHPTIAVRHILTKAVPDENGVYTDEAKDAAKARAEEIYNEWLAGEATEESFAALAEQYSEDAGSNTNGGLYDSITPGQTVPEFDAFCFDDARMPGDTGVVYGESGAYAGYHVMYFVGEGDLDTGRETIQRERMNDMLNDLTSVYEVTYGPYISLAGLI